MGDERRRAYPRVGNTAKCPACGVPMDPGAYRCPRCLIYFCFKCRRRVQQRDPQFQCVNQQCEQYGRMLCNASIVEVPVMHDRSRQELMSAEVPGYGKQSISGQTLFRIFLIGAPVLGGAGIYFGLSWWGGAVAGVVLSGILVGWLSRFEDRIPVVPAVYRTITENVEVGRSKCCIACRQAVQQL